MTDWKTDGVPTEPGLYLVQLVGARRYSVLPWSEGQRDWRDGAVKQQVRRYHGPHPHPPRPAYPERIRRDGHV